MPISSVVLSSQRVDMKDALYDAAKSKERAKDNAVNPLVQDGKKLVPSVTRVFAQNRDITFTCRPTTRRPGLLRLDQRLTLRRRRSLPRSWRSSRCIRTAARRSGLNRSR